MTYVFLPLLSHGLHEVLGFENDIPDGVHSPAHSLALFCLRALGGKLDLKKNIYIYMKAEWLHWCHHSIKCRRFRANVICIYNVFVYTPCLACNLKTYLYPSCQNHQPVGSPNRPDTSPQANVTSAASTKDEVNRIWCVCVCVCVLRIVDYMHVSLRSTGTVRHWLSFDETKIFWLGGSQQICIPSKSSISQSKPSVN